MDDGSGVAETPECRREYTASLSTVVETRSEESAEAEISTETPSVTASGIDAASSTSGRDDDFAAADRADGEVRLRSTTLTPYKF